ncbi:TPA: cysteine hydrolase [Candidatus Ventrenecus stercoripullorum]|nr:cysteine hydrolase [Candidatus Ventrenecus stercoripullorum]
MKTLLLVIDVQKTFINENTEFVVSKIQSLIDASLYDMVAFTRFLNTENSKFIRELDFRGAIGEDKELVLPSGEHKVFDKEIYTCYNLEFQNFVKENQIDKIYLCGIDTECCVLKTAFDFFEHDYDVYILKDYTACMWGSERHENALEILKRNIGSHRVI